MKEMIIKGKKREQWGTFDYQSAHTLSLSLSMSKRSLFFQKLQDLLDLGEKVNKGDTKFQIVLLQSLFAEQ